MRCHVFTFERVLAISMKIVSIDELLGSVFNPSNKKVTHILGHSSKKKRLNDNERR